MTKEFLRSNFMVLCLGATIIFLYPVLFLSKGELELLINQNHSPILDVFFKYITHLGDGSLLAILLVVLLFYNYSSAILTTFTIVLQSIFVSIFKRWIFKGLERPLAFFGDEISLNFVEGVNVHSSNTFPSGHTATGFALFALVFIVINNRGVIISTLLFFLAFCVGFSRVYLLQHFVIDVYFGAIFGLISVVIALIFMEKIFSQTQLIKFNQASLRDVISRKRKL